MNPPSVTDFALRSGRCLGSVVNVPCGRGFIALLEAFRGTGGTAPCEIMGRLLEEHQVGNAVSLTKLIYTGQVFGFEWRATVWIPMFQFDTDDLALKSGPRRVRAALPSQWSGWTVASWFAAPNARLDDRSPADMLESGFDAVLGSARSLEPVEELARPLVRRSHRVAAHV